MKMKVIDRILLALYALIGILALAYVGLRIVRPELMGSASEWLIGAYGQTWARIAIAALMALLLIWSVHMLLLAFRHGEKKGDKNSVSVQNGGDGSVRVTVAAMDTLVRQAIGPAEGVVNLKTKVINHEDSITVKIDMCLAADAHIPNVTMLMQRNIKRFIEEYSGIAVREVVILVTEIRAVEQPATPARLTGGEEKAPQAERLEAAPSKQEEAPVSQPVQEETPAPRPESVIEPAPAPVREGTEKEAAGEADEARESGDEPLFPPHVPELKLDYLEEEASFQDGGEDAPEQEADPAENTDEDPQEGPQHE